MLRSQRMGCYQVIVSRELAWEMINTLGELGDNMVEFIDSNKDISQSARIFSRFIKRCEEIQNNLTRIKLLLLDYGFDIQHCDDVETFLQKLREFLNTRDRLEKTYIDDINQEIDSFTKQIFSNAAQIDELEKKYKDLKEQTATYLFYKDKLINSLYSMHREELDNKKKSAIKQQQKDEEEEGIVSLSSQPISRKKVIQKHRNEEDADWEDQFMTKSFTTVIGTIETEAVHRFIRSIYRLTKGNFWNTHKVHAELPDRTIFILFFPVASIQNSFLIGKINKLLDAFNTKIYKSIINKDEVDQKLLQIEQDKTDVFRVITIAKKQLYCDLEEWSLPRNGLNCSKIIEMQLFVEKERSIYTQLNSLKPRKHVFIGRLWCPKDYQEQLMQTQVKLSLLYPSQGQAQIIECETDDEDTPPTLFKLNVFTAPFQEIVNTYGVPRYKEINPGIYCIIMFSMQFGIMFGDIGHGGILFLLGLYLCIRSQKNPFDQKKDLNALYSVRFVILLLGFFALYSGLIYNDFFSLPIYMFHKSCYIKDHNDHGDLIFVKKPNCNYPFGFDPKWYVAQNELNFFNSFKMKLSVIIGVTQMIFGILLKGFNHKYFGQWIEFFFEFIPQLVFMVCTFGYMIFMIILKWSIDFSGDTSQAPSIINLMINLPLQLGAIPDGKTLWNQEDQEDFQSYILFIAVCMVPLMLFPKPFILYLKSKNGRNKVSVTKKGSLNENLIPEIEKRSSEEEFIKELRQSQTEKELSFKKELLRENSKLESLDDVQFKKLMANKHEFDFSEVFVHQVIETIEFVLGSISSTASYLRLWALSLAHSQLARVFFEKTIGAGIIQGNTVQIFIGWFVFVHITLFVLMSMDVMECFLHAIRLQWVEFQGKFYKADGVWFNSFSFIGNLREFNVELSKGIK